MVLPKSKNAVGLGNSLMNDRFGKGKGSDMRRGNYQEGGIQRTGVNGETVRVACESEST
jgi:large subunit GTPase 1